MTAAPTSSLPTTYHGALREYLAQPTDAALRQASELGRAAMSAGLGVFDLIRLHHQALDEGVLSEDPAAIVRSAPAIEAFLLETLSPFEAAHRGFRRAWERLEQLNSTLAGHNEALALSNAQLDEEISMRMRTEAELRESKDHYFELFKKASAMEESLRELSAQVLTAQEEERKRISRELHDEIGQTLTAVNVAIALLKRDAGQEPRFRKKLAEVSELLTSSMETVHAFARELRPAMLDHLGVHAAIRSHVSTFTHRTGIPVALGTHKDLERIRGQQGEVLFRVVQEALCNVYKHAHATNASISFSSAGGTFSMLIADNGQGFAAGNEAAVQAGRLGLLGMQERVRLVHGSLTIDATPGRGTRITVQIPLEQSASQPPAIEESHSHENDIRIAR